MNILSSLSLAASRRQHAKTSDSRTARTSSTRGRLSACAFGDCGDCPLCFLAAADKAAPGGGGARGFGRAEHRQCLTAFWVGASSLPPARARGNGAPLVLLCFPLVRGGAVCRERPACPVAPALPGRDRTALACMRSRPCCAGASGSAPARPGFACCHAADAATAAAAAARCSAVRTARFLAALCLIRSSKPCLSACYLK